jgi:hypothetical protein
VHRHPVSPLESVKLFLSGLKTAGLGHKILWGKDLAERYSIFKELFLTAFAGAIMNESEMNRKVRCHTGGLWKTVGAKSLVGFCFWFQEMGNVPCPRFCSVPGFVPPFAYYSR